ncbi:MAG: hypothetical protein QOH39_1520 [Verrucomicrobiota bacterium]|jgi:hypothetical protein
MYVKKWRTKAKYSAVTNLLKAGMDLAERLERLRKEGVALHEETGKLLKETRQNLESARLNLELLQA